MGFSGSADFRNYRPPCLIASPGTEFADKLASHGFSRRQPPGKRHAAAPHGSLTRRFAALRTNRRDGAALS